MFTQIIVPLDGSRRAAAAVPLAASLARAWDCQITLIGVHTRVAARGSLRRTRAASDERRVSIAASLDDLASMLLL